MLLGYNPNWAYGSYVERMNMSTDRFDTWVATVIGCLIEKEKSRYYVQKKYADVYGKMVETATCQMIGNVRGL